MSWNAYYVNIILQSDIHCGDQALGFIAKTFPFVPCHLPFFALTPAAVQCLQIPDQHSNYKKIEKFFLECIRTTPFYIYDTKEGHILFPWNKEDREILEYYYLSSNYGVSIDYTKRSAKKEHLYEIEFIMANRRYEFCHAKNSVYPTELHGAIFFKQHENNEFSLDNSGILHWNSHKTSLKELLETMHLGGKQYRSLGRSGLIKIDKSKDKLLWDLYHISLNNSWPELTVAQNQKGPMPLANSKDSSKIIDNGNEKVLTGRRYTSKGPGLGMDNPGFVFSEGWEHRDASLTVKMEHPRYTVLVN